MLLICCSCFTWYPLCSFAFRPVMGLEFSRYLENYLWPHFSAERVSADRVRDDLMMHKMYHTISKYTHIHTVHPSLPGVHCPDGK